MSCCKEWEDNKQYLAQKDSMQFCPYCGVGRVPDAPLPRHIEVKAYVHGSKESVWELGEEIGLSEKAMETFIYALYEVELSLRVDTETGESEILSAK